MKDTTAQDIGEDALGCPRCQASLEVASTAARCTGCGSEYPVDEGVVCTNRTNIFMGEFDGPRMMEFVRAARERGWRQTVTESMLTANPRAETVLLSPERGSFLELLDTPARGTVLDLGAGMGTVSLQLAKSFGRVYSVDQTFERLAFLQVVASQEGERSIRTVCHRDVFGLPFRSGTLDAAVMIGVFEYFPASYPGQRIADVQRLALAELNRVLAPGGVLFIATKNRFGWPNWAGAKDNSGLAFGPLMPRWLANVLSRRLLNKPFRTVTDSYWRYSRLLRDAGFADLRFFWPVEGYQASRSWVPVADRKALAAKVQEQHAWTGFKRRALSLMCGAGLLKYAVPHFGIVARKPR